MGIKQVHSHASQSQEVVDTAVDSRINISLRRETYNELRKFGYVGATRVKKAEGAAVTR